MSTGVKMGLMNDAEKAEIDRLCVGVENPKPQHIARRLNRHVGTVTWYMITNGLIVRRIKYRTPPTPYKRNGYWVYPYTPEQDARILALRTAGMSTPKIASTISREFNVPRTAHSILVRLEMLAAYDMPEEGVVA